ncbi:MAG: DUF4340 domain-containing protein [Planctomycetota bacterium]
MSRINQILFALLVALIGIFIILEKPWVEDAFEQSEARLSRPLFEEFDSTKAAKIIVKKGATEIEVRKAAVGWTLPAVSNFIASEERVARLLERVSAMNRKDLVTSDKSQHSRYSVTEADAPRVIISDSAGKAIADFYQGKPYFDMNEIQDGGRLNQLDCYVRAAASDEVYRITPFESLEPIQISDWLPKNLYKFDISAIQTLTLSGSEFTEQLAINRLPDGNWRVVSAGGDTAGNKEACEALARSLSSMYLSDLAGVFNPSEAAKYGFDIPRIHAKMVLTGNTNEELIIGKDIEAALEEGESQSAYALGGVAKTHVAKVYKSSLAALKVTKQQLIGTPESAPAVPESNPSPIK